MSHFINSNKCELCWRVRRRESEVPGRPCRVSARSSRTHNLHDVREWTSEFSVQQHRCGNELANAVSQHQATVRQHAAPGSRLRTFAFYAAAGARWREKTNHVCVLCMPRACVVYRSTHRELCGKHCSRSMYVGIFIFCMRMDSVELLKCVFGLSFIFNFHWHLFESPNGVDSVGRYRWHSLCVSSRSRQPN